MPVAKVDVHVAGDAKSDVVGMVAHAAAVGVQLPPRGGRVAVQVVDASRGHLAKDVACPSVAGVRSRARTR